MTEQKPDEDIRHPGTGVLRDPEGTDVGEPEYDPDEIAAGERPITPDEVLRYHDQGGEA